MKILLYWRTIKHLSASQLAWYLKYRFSHPKAHMPDTVEIRSPIHGFLHPVIKPASYLHDNRFRFLNREAEINRAADWNNSDLPRLWLFNLHYFDFLNQSGIDENIGAHWIDRWIADNPVGCGNGWSSYTISLRVVNWIKWHLAGHLLAEAQLRSLFAQTDFLSRSIEYHLRTNHLLANAKALIFAGMFFKGSKADDWLEKGASILRREMHEQVLPDGGHCERSPMYHGIVLEDFLDIFNITGVMEDDAAVSWLREQLRQKIAPMFTWLRTMRHPNGELGLFNDTALKIAADLKDLNAYAGRLGIELISEPGPVEHVCLLGSSGFFRMHGKPWFILGDIGTVRPSYQPGHAHAEALSFEASLGGSKVFVNSGISCYGTSDERVRQRGSAAHNCLTIDGRDMSEVWSGHRVARRANVYDVHAGENGSDLRVTATHDGYRRICGAGPHRRVWRINGPLLSIADEAGGKGKHFVELNLHLHPAWQITEVCGNNVLIAGNNECGSKISVTFENQLEVVVMRSTYHPEFGVSLPNRKLVARGYCSLPFRHVTTITAHS